MATRKIISNTVKTTTPRAGVTVSENNDIVSISFIVDLTATSSPSQWVEVCDAPIPAGSPLYSFGAAIDFTDAMLVATRLYNGKLWVDARVGTKNYRGNITYLKD